MNLTTETTLLFAAHMLALLVALGTALVLAGEATRSRAARAAGTLGFLSIGLAEAIHGAGLAAEADPPTLLFRAAGYLLLLFAAAFPVAASDGVAAFLALPAGAIVPAAVGLVAGALSGWQRRHERSGVWLGVGLMLLAIGDSLLAADRGWVLGASHVVRAAGYLSLAWFSFAATRRSIRFRMVTAFVALLLAVVVAISSAVTQVLGANLRESVASGVTRQALSSVEALGPEAEAATEQLRVLEVSFREDMRAGEITEEQADGILSLFSDQDFVVFTDEAGRVLQAGGGEIDPADATQLAGTRAVRTALSREQPFVTLDTFGEDRLVVLGVQPVERRFGGIHGVVAIGAFIDDDLLDRFVSPGTPSAVFAGSDPVPAASTFETVPRDQPLVSESVVSELRERALSPGGGEAETMAIAGEQYFVSVVPLRREPNVPIATLLVAQPASVLADAQRGITQVIFLVALGAAAVALTLALVVSRRITLPVVALTRAARRVQAGDLGVRAGTRGDDEVADLGRAFNSMTASVTTMTEELRDAAEEQARLRARLETVLNSMGDGLIAVNDAGRVVTYNPAAGAILGLPRSRVMGRPLKDVLRGRTADGRPVLAGRGATNGLAFIRRKDGDDVPVAITSSALRDGDGASVGRVYVLRDMTREHQVERMKSEFLSNVSHELRTPLTPIIGYSELLSRRAAAPGQAQEFAGGILESAKRLERVVGMLVDFSALEAGRMALSTERVQLGPIVKGVVDAWKDRSEKHRFVTKIPRRLPQVDVDVSLVRRIVDELVDNAVKYSPKGGRVTVELSEEAVARRRMLRVDVNDEGIGIEPEDLARIFQDFRQLDASDTRMFGGLGLGLTFVKRIVEAHGGRVEATSEAARGSTFSFLLPAADTGKGRKRT